MYLYDIIVSDGRYKIKCFLPNHYGHLFQKYKITVGTQILVKEVKIMPFEKEMKRTSYVILKEFDICGYSVICLPYLPFLKSSASKREIGPYPLETGRLYYLNPWIQNIPYGPAWDIKDPHLQDIDRKIPIQPVVSLDEVSSQWKAWPKPFPPIIVVVLLQARLHHYGRVTNDKPFPFQGYLEVGDNTGTCGVVLWDKANVGKFNFLPPGSILLLSKYHVSYKQPREVNPCFRGDVNLLSRLPVEIKINDCSQIYLLNLEDAKEFFPLGVSLPNVQFEFVTRDKISTHPPDTTVDVVGLVTYVGHYVRERCSAPGGFWVYKVIEMIDSSSKLPFRIQLYVHNQIKPYDELLPGKVLICTQMRIVGKETTTVSSVTGDQCLRDVSSLSVTMDRDLYLTSSGESMIYFLEELEERQKNVPVIQALLRFMNETQEKLWSSLQVGGIYLFPEHSTSLEEFQFGFSVQQPMESYVITGDTWFKKIASLDYKEHQLLIVHGILVHLEYVDLNAKKIDEGGWSLLSSASVSEHTYKTVYLNPRLHEICRNVETLGCTFPTHAWFPHQFSTKNRNVLKNWLRFPAFSADDLFLVPTDEDLQGIPVSCSSYYVLELASGSTLYNLRCLMFPKAAKSPYPTLQNLLSGNYSICEPEDKNDFWLYSSKYSLDEVEVVKSSAVELHEKEMLWVLDVYSTSSVEKEIIVRRAFPV
ncbi:RPA-related protein RADX-like isoform X2 [Tachypleus tridentatus]